MRRLRGAYGSITILKGSEGGVRSGVVEKWRRGVLCAIQRTQFCNNPLPEPYPVFHVTAITHRKDAVYPATLAGSAIADIIAQGWVLQKSWDADASLGKNFALAHPGKFNQIIFVWDAFAAYENDRWSHLEMFGVEPK